MSPRPQRFVVGYNQAWLAPCPEKYDAWRRYGRPPTGGMHFGHDMVAHFDPVAVRWMMRLVRHAGGHVVRLWAFEGPSPEGVLFRGLRPVGIIPGLLGAARRIMRTAREERVKVYWVAVNGNWEPTWPGQGSETWLRHRALLTDRLSGDSFDRSVLLPFLAAITRFPDVLYGLDLMNEINFSVPHFCNWSQLQEWVRARTRFVRGLYPWLDISASVAGDHRDAADQLQRLTGLGLSRYDIHLYHDDGEIPPGLLDVVDGPRLLLGEFGQRCTREDDAVQVNATRLFLQNALASGFEGALAWRLIDWPKGKASDGRGRHDRHTFYRPSPYGLGWPGLDPRPAVATVRAFVGLGPPSGSVRCFRRRLRVTP